MKNNRGFTLIELLAVIVVLAILMTLILPNALKMGENVKKKTYQSKINTMELRAASYGNVNSSLVKTGTNLINSNDHFTCRFTYKQNSDDIESVQYNYSSSGYQESMTLNDNEYWCTRLTVADLVNSNNISWDSENNCNGNCTEENKKHYDNIVINPTNNNIINNCYIYLYYKYNRVYAHFDLASCDVETLTFEDGHEYHPL